MKGWDMRRYGLILEKPLSKGITYKVYIED
jgi:hypothetical protein